MGFGYDLFIERPERPLTFEEWSQLLASRDDLAGEAEGEVIWSHGPDGEDEAYLRWVPGAHSIIVRMPIVDGREVLELVDLATGIDAVVVGESGEVYPIIDA